MATLISQATHQGVYSENLKKRTLTIMKSWIVNYRTRQHLASLPPHLYEDVGLSRTEVESELKKSFWEK